MRLAVTERCLVEDLRFPQDRDWHTLDNPVLKAFSERRSEAPEGGERIRGLVGVIDAPIFSLHYGTARAGTWYDEIDDVVWLVGVGWDHNYDHLIDLGRRERLLPAPTDQARLDAPPMPAEVLDHMFREAADLVRASNEQRGVPLNATLGGAVHIRICHELGEPTIMTLAISERMAIPDLTLPKSWQFALAQLFFPGVSFEDFLPFPERFDRTEVRQDELAFQYFVTS